MKEQEIEKLAKLEIKKTIKGERLVFYFPKKQQFLRWDIFGVFDFLTLDTVTGKVEFFQITTIQHMSERRKKIVNWLQNDNVRYGYFHLWGWDSKKGLFKKERAFYNQ